MPHRASAAASARALEPLGEILEDLLGDVDPERSQRAHLPAHACSLGR
jgi:hypothetical protein